MQFHKELTIFLLLLIPSAISQFCIAPGEFCLNSGACVELSEGVEFCACFDGWMGVFCECRCKQGVCVKDDSFNDTIEGRMKCQCTQGWVGPNCDIPCSASTTCSNHGTCNASGLCACDTHWAGFACNVSALCAECETDGRGRCENETCICNGDRQGPTCACSPSRDCSNQGVCNSSASKAHCHCNAGYFGPSCSEHPTPAPALCRVHTRCADCQNKGGCVWEESRCMTTREALIPDSNACEAEAASGAIWVPIVASLGGVVLLATFLYLYQRYRRFATQKQLNLNSTPGGPAWFSTPEPVAEDEEYVYMDTDEDDAGPH